jgi:hypothetical protein
MTFSSGPWRKRPATFAEADLMRMRTREGMAVAHAKGRPRGRQPKLSPKQQAELRRMHPTGDYSITDVTEVRFCTPRAGSAATARRDTTGRPLGKAE